VTPLEVVITVLAGSAGALLRHVVTRVFAARPARLPWAVVIVNVAGSLVAGAVVGVEAGVQPIDQVHLILITGFAGGLTTFSTFSTETVQLIAERRVRTAVISVAANLVLGAAGFATGFVGALAVVFAVGAGGQAI
jgi:CrcB protein